MTNKEPQPQDICICGHHTKDHSYDPNKDDAELECDICKCMRFTPQPQDVSNSQQDNSERMADDKASLRINVPNLLPADTLSSLIEKTKKEIERLRNTLEDVDLSEFPKVDVMRLNTYITMFINEAKLQAYEKCAEMIKNKWKDKHISTDKILFMMNFKEALLGEEIK